MAKIGVSLPPRALLGGHPLAEEAGGPGRLLEKLAAAGVSHVELRAVAPGSDDGLFADCVEAARAAKLSCTVHSSLTEAGGREFAASIPAALPETVFTAHAFTGEDMSRAFEKTVLTMKSWCDALAEGGHTLAIENNRRKGKNDPGDSFDGAFAIFEAVNRKNTGVTFDFGHYYYNALQFHDAPRMLPAQEQLAAVRHTHIHGLFQNKTHHPLAGGSVPYAYYIDALKDAGYDGVYNLEISLAGAGGSVLEGIFASLGLLAEALD